MNNSKIKILLINDTYFDLGGAEVYFFNLIKHLKVKNYDVHSMGFKEKENIGQKDFIYKDTSSTLNRYFQRVFFNPFLYFKLRKWIKKVNPDIIHLNNINKATSTLLYAIKGYKTVMTVHDYGLVCPSLWCVHKDSHEVCNGCIGGQCIKHKCIPFYYYPFVWFHNKTRNHMLKKQVSVFISAGETLKKYLLKNKFNRVKVISLPVGLNNEQMTSFEKGNVLFVGALELNKGINNLVDSFENVYLKCNDAKLTIIGEGSLKRDLKEKIKSFRSRNNIKFIGKIPHGEIIKYYKFANVVVVPSVWQETFSFVVAEAMAMGKPVIVTDRGEPANLVADGVNGYIVSPNDTEKMTELILKIIGDEKLCERMSKESLKRANNLIDNNHFQKIEKIYKDVSSCK